MTGPGLKAHDGRTGQRTPSSSASLGPHAVCRHVTAAQGAPLVPRPCLSLFLNRLQAAIPLVEAVLPLRRAPSKQQARRVALSKSLLCFAVLTLSPTGGWPPALGWCCWARRTLDGPGAAGPKGCAAWDALTGLRRCTRLHVQRACCVPVSDNLPHPAFTAVRLDSQAAAGRSCLREVWGEAP